MDKPQAAPELVLDDGSQSGFVSFFRNLHQVRKPSMINCYSANPTTDVLTVVRVFMSRTPRSSGFSTGR